MGAGSSIWWIIFSGIIMVSAGGYVSYLTKKLLKGNKQIKELESKLSELEQRVHPLQLEVLEAKLNPHLFKNILNSIQSHAYQTYYAMDKLSCVLDYILYESRKRLVSLREELDFALNFIEVNKVKISPLFDLKVKNTVSETDPLYEQALLIPLVSVDLIENAFKHADLQSPDSFISIVAGLEGHCFTLSVANKISAQKPLKKEKGGLGLESLRQRLDITYDGLYSLESHIQNEDVFITQLTINLLEYKIKMLTAR